MEYLKGKKVRVDCTSCRYTGEVLNDIDYDSPCIVIKVEDSGVVSIPLEEVLHLEPIDEDTEPGIKMSPDKFKALLDELDGNSLQTLKEKNARYAQNGDCLHNFRSGADIAGGTPAQACWGYLTKHLVALRDMVERDDFSNREDFLEKCQDTINYVRFLWCIGNDENDKTNKKESN